MQSNVIIGRDGALEVIEQPWAIDLPETKTKKKKKKVEDIPQTAHWLKPQEDKGDDEEEEKKETEAPKDKWAILKQKQKEDLFAQK